MPEAGWAQAVRCRTPGPRAHSMGPVPADLLAGAGNPGNVGFADAPGIKPRLDSDEPLRVTYRGHRQHQCRR
jgi:hypothetical protein